MPGRYRFRLRVANLKTRQKENDPLSSIVTVGQGQGAFPQARDAGPRRGDERSFQDGARSIALVYNQYCSNG
jgi:hypothetical protein